MALPPALVLALVAEQATAGMVPVACTMWGGAPLKDTAARKLTERIHAS